MTELKRLLYCALTICCISVSGELYAQKNLVKNPSFEEYTSIPVKDADWGKIVFWKSANNATPDLFSLDGYDKAKLPDVCYGNTQPYSGRSCIGLYFSGTSWMEYLTGELSEPMVVGRRYKVTFYITNGYSTKYASNGVSNIGIAFTEGNPFQNINGPISAVPQYKTVEPFYSQTWNKLSFVYQADKPYKYITIGLFANLSSDVKAVNWPGLAKSTYSSAYYFFDDISVEQTFESVTFDMTALPKPAGSPEKGFATYSTPLGGADDGDRVSSLTTPKSVKEDLNSFSFVEESGTKINSKPKVEDELPSFKEEPVAPPVEIVTPPKEEAPPAKIEPPVVIAPPKVEIEDNEDPPAEVLGRHVEVQKIIESRRQKIKIKVWDGKEVDGDIIKLVLNGEVILDKFTLEKEAHVIEVTLTGTHNFLALHALNLGKIPPNTANVSVSNEDGEIMLELKSTLKNSGILRIDYKP